MADRLSSTSLSIYTNAGKVCIGMSERHGGETHCIMRPDEAERIAETIRQAAVVARMKGPA